MRAKAAFLLLAQSLIVEPFQPRHIHSVQNQRAATTINFIHAPVSSSSSSSFDQLLEALEIYKDMHNGSVHVPSNFRVPASYPYPPNLHNMSLGRRVVDIRKGKAYNSDFHKRRLNSLGFVWNVSEEKFSNCLNLFFFNEIS